jgi:mRNA interferase HigB
MLRMPMRIVSRRTLFEFWAKHPEAKASLQHWLSIAKEADWQSMEDVVKTLL